MSSRKGFFKIIEAVAAILLALVFLLYIIPFFHETEPSKTDMHIFEDMPKDPGFRNCVLAENKTCINATLIRYYNKFDKLYDYEIIIGDKDIDLSSLPEESVAVESYLIAGNYTSYEPKTIRIIYWERAHYEDYYRHQ
ncbi:hypothetical protein JW968_03050 [Candidatus Woesearchaeota archaeon]|nr:hypothetical protein [Candidatus Woesearchaeota archaeon]